MIFNSFAGRGTMLKPPTSNGPTPYVAPTSPPPGTYDPGLDFQGENANLGFGFAAQDNQLAHAQTGEDFTSALGKAIQAHTDRTNALGTAAQRAETDYGTNQAALGRQYGNLAERQSEALYGSGTAQGGAAIQSAQRRNANQALDQGKLSQAIERFRADNQAQSTQEAQSWRDLVGNAGAGTSLSDVMANPGGYGSLGQQASRAIGTADTSFARAGLENVLFGDQLNRAKTYSAQQAGLLPTRPEGSYAALAPGQSSQVFGGVEYGPGGGSFLAPVSQRPSAESVLATGSLLGTRLDPNRYRRLK